MLTSLMKTQDVKKKRGGQKVACENSSQARKNIQGSQGSHSNLIEAPGFSLF